MTLDSVAQKVVKPLSLDWEGEQEMYENLIAMLLFYQCGKIFEISTFNQSFHFLDEDELLSQYHSCAYHNNSCNNQSLSIVHNYANFDQNVTFGSNLLK